MRKLLSLSISAAVLAWGGVGIAAPAADQVRTEVVSLTDLNLSSANGAKVALNRINSAVDRVCANGASPRDLGAWADYHACRAHAMDSSVTRLNAPLVTARYYKTTPAPTELLASR